MKAEELKGKVDFGVITIREDEFEAILQRFPPDDTIKKNNIYNIHRMPLSDNNENYVIAAVRSPEQGPIKAQSVALDLIRDLDPQWILLVGIAGGFPDDEFTLGDVVAAMRLHDFSVEAVIEGKPSEYANHGGPMHKAVQVHLANLPAMKRQLGDWNQKTSIGQPRPSVKLVAKNFYGDDKWRKKVKKAMNAHFGKTAQPRLPKAVTAAIVSSGKLVKDSETVKQWFRNARDLRAVEMELAGVYEAANQIDRVYPVLAIRGISDIVGFDREPQWTGYACHTAAAFTHALLKTRPIEPKATLLAQDSRPSSRLDIQKPSLQERLLRVFLCHSSNDKPTVRNLYKRLKADRFEPWLDEEDLIPGQDWQLEIRKAIRNADVVIVCLSRESVSKADFIQKEIKFALDVADEQPEGSVFIIPLKLEECEVPDRLKRWHWGSFYEEKGYDRLLVALHLIVVG